MSTSNAGSGSQASPPFSAHATPTGRLQPARRDVPRGWWVMFAGALLIAVYALGYLILGDRIYPPNLADSFRARPWGIYTHAFAAMFALGLGAFQFRAGLRERRPRVHRVIGRIYVPAALLTGASGLYMAAYSHSGMITHLGFGFLGAAVLATTSVAFIRIRALNIVAHREWMIRSYALIFAAVMLRVLLPLLIIAYKGDFDPAYRWVAWLCWVPNVLWAEWYIRRSRESNAVPGPSRRPALVTPANAPRARRART